MKYELNHDVIAKQVFEKASADMKARRKVELLIKNAYEFYQKRQALMTVEQLEEIRPFRNALKLKPEEITLIEDSERSISRAQRRKFLITMGVIAALTATMTFAMWQWYKAAERERFAEAGRLALLAQKELSRFNFNDAFHLAGESIKLEPNNLIAQDILSQVFHNSGDHKLVPLSTAVFKADSLYDIIVSDNGNFVAIISDSLVKVYDVSNSPILRGSTKFNASTFEPIFSPDNNHLVTLNSDNSIQISEIDDKDSVILRGHTDFVRGVKFLNKDSLISWSNDGFIKLWHTKNGFIKDIGQHLTFVESVEISSDSVHILSINAEDYEKKIKATPTIWSLNENENEFSLLHLNQVFGGKFWNKDSILILGTNGIEMWSRKQKKEIVRPLPLEIDETEFYNQIFSSDANNLIYFTEIGDLTDVGTHYNYLLNIHDYFDLFGGKSKDKARVLKEYQQMSNIKSFDPKDFLNSMKRVSNIAVTDVGFFDNDHIFTTTSGSNEVTFRDISGKATAILAHPKEVLGMAYSKNKQVMATYSMDGWVKIWKQNTLPLITLKNIAIDKENTYFSQVYLSSNDSRIITLANNSPMCVYDKNGVLLRVDSTKVEYANFSPTKSAFVTVAMDSSVLMWDSTVTTYKKLKFEGRPDAISFSSDGRYLMLYGNKKVGIYDEKGELLHNKIQTNDEIFSGQFIPNSDHYILVSRDSFVSEWDINGNLVRHLIQHQLINSINLSPDGKTYVVGDSDGNTVVYDFKTAQKLYNLGKEQHSISSIQFFPDGKRLIAYNEGNMSFVYNMEKDAKVKQLFSGKSSKNIDFVSKGRDLLVTFSDGIELWNSNLVKITCLKEINSTNKSSNYSNAVSKDGKRFFIVFSDGTAEEYYTPEGILDCLKLHPDLVFHEEDKKRYQIVVE